MEKNEMGKACSKYGERRGAYEVLVGRPEVKRPLGRFRLGWKDTINNDLQEVGNLCMEWIGLAQDRDRCWAIVNVAMNFRVP
jgi:hypothetical protein